MQSSIREVAFLRVAASDDPEWFLRAMSLALSVESRGADLATAAWTTADPVRAAAEIEALAGLRRLSRKDHR
ncbi:hypothetical protein ACLQ2N_16570 [Streptomyces sp. DT224]|uniref:hypothetical protein n=1 Tax=Streptomyces sp. DT224 TaxID=3393426 RepID=UPI003CF8721B